MRSLLCLVAVLSAAALGLAAQGHAGATTPKLIVDPLRGQAIDFEHTWAWWGTGDPSDVAFAETPAGLEVDVAATAQPGFGASGETRCRVSGDFDARVSFDLVTWPAANGVWVNLSVSGTPYNVYRVSWQFDPTEQWGAYLPPAGGTTPADGTSGTLRLTRTGDLYTAYYASAGRDWVPIDSGTGPTGDVPIGIGVFGLAGVATFTGPVQVRFHNLFVRADATVCA